MNQPRTSKKGENREHNRATTKGLARFRNIGMLLQHNLIFTLRLPLFRQSTPYLMPFSHSQNEGLSHLCEIGQKSWGLVQLVLYYQEVYRERQETTLTQRVPERGSTALILWVFAFRRITYLSGGFSCRKTREMNLLTSLAGLVD